MKVRNYKLVTLIGTIKLLTKAAKGASTGIQAAVYASTALTLVM